MDLGALVRKHGLTAVTVALFGLALWRLGLSAELPAVLVFIFGGVLLAVIDWRVQRLPKEIIYKTGAAMAACLVFATAVRGEWMPLVTALGGAAIFANAFFFVHFVGKEVYGMTLVGFGDVRLAALLGLLLGWYGLPYVAYGAIAGTILAAVVALVLCIKQRKIILRYSFGPPLIVGTLAVVLLRS